MSQLGHDLSMPQLGHNLQRIRLEQGHDYSLAVIKAESLYLLMYLRIIVYKITMGKRVA